jgi:hypothetical protein
LKEASKKWVSQYHKKSKAEPEEVKSKIFDLNGELKETPLWIETHHSYLDREEQVGA